MRNWQTLLFLLLFLLPGCSKPDIYEEARRKTDSDPDYMLRADIAQQVQIQEARVVPLIDSTGERFSSLRLRWKNNGPKPISVLSVLIAGYDADGNLHSSSYTEGEGKWVYVIDRPKNRITVPAGAIVDDIAAKGDGYEFLFPERDYKTTGPVVRVNVVPCTAAIKDAHDEAENPVLSKK